MKLYDIIQNNEQYRIEHIESFHHAVSTKKKEYFFILSVRTAMKIAQSLPQDYHIDYLLDLSYCLRNGPRYMLLHLSTSMPYNVLISYYYSQPHNYNIAEEELDNLSHKPIPFYNQLPPKYTESYIQYLSQLDRCLLSQQPRNTNLTQNTLHGHEWYELISVPYSNFDKTKLYCEYYIKNNSDIRKLLQTSRVVSLSDVASYVYINRDAVLRKNDIVMKNWTEACDFIASEGILPQKATDYGFSFYCILQAKTNLLEAVQLYAYLISPLAKRIRNLLSPEGIEMYSSLPIPLPLPKEIISESNRILSESQLQRKAMYSIEDYRQIEIPQNMINISKIKRDVEEIFSDWLHKKWNSCDSQIRKICIFFVKKWASDKTGKDYITNQKDQQKRRGIYLNSYDYSNILWPNLSSKQRIWFEKIVDDGNLSTHLEKEVTKKRVLSKKDIEIDIDYLAKLLIDYYQLL